MIYNVKITNGNRQEVADYIRMKKSQGKFRVVDVGGVFGGWSMPFVDALIDFSDPGASLPSHIMHFKCDITNPRDWSRVLEYIGKEGKYDFCICTHTLEDIMNPVFVSEQIAKISLAVILHFLVNIENLPSSRGIIEDIFIIVGFSQ
jgi:hypothetical protein